MHLKHNYVRRTNCFIARFVVTQAGEVEPQLLWHGESDESNTIHDTISLKDAPAYHYNICGPCYGIYYLWNPWLDEDIGSRCLWNPALYEIKNLPPKIMKRNISSYMNTNTKSVYNEVYGFGFDPMTVDYKVVIINGCRLECLNLTDEYGCKSFLEYFLSIRIYSLRTDSWKYLGDLSKRFYIPPDNSSCHTFVNRSFYWLGSYKEYAIKHDVIFSIDLATEECQEIILPDIIIKEEMSYSECLMVYNGLIALVALYKEECTFDIWTLKGTTWNKELKVQLDRRVWKPIGHYSVDNNLVLFDSPNCLVLCDPNTKETLELTKETWELKISNYGYDVTCKIVSAYRESLVPLNDRDFWDQSDERPW
ncbi:F-box protein CPR1-like [Silene latifolia]|uniref:F-box protein CPR1-like n=1 Tax=Silene latifolia TaxID=37657 RepID=UPI003D775901